jgi:hypothetical protein
MTLNKNLTSAAAEKALFPAAAGMDDDAPKLPTTAAA